jgi:hypothetical protein
MKQKKILKRILITTTIVFLALLITISGYLSFNTYKALPEAITASKSDNVTKERGLLIFEPQVPTIGNIIFYQGGLVQTESYSLLAQGLTDVGFRVFMPKMPLNLAILNTNAYRDILSTYPSELPWIMMGHSLGGATGAIALANDQLNIEGLVLLAAYTTESSDLSQSSLNVLSVVGAHDKVLSWENYDAYQSLLPESTTYAVLEEGNHGGFGHYGQQKGDGQSTITSDEQQAQLIQLLLEWLEN